MTLFIFSSFLFLSYLSVRGVDRFSLSSRLVHLRYILKLAATFDSEVAQKILTTNSNKSCVHGQGIVFSNPRPRKVFVIIQREKVHMGLLHTFILLLYFSFIAFPSWFYRTLSHPHSPTILSPSIILMGIYLCWNISGDLSAREYFHTTPLGWSG